MKNKQKKDILATRIFLGVGTIFLVLFGIMAAAPSETKDCSNSKGNTVIVIDRTDPYSEKTADEINKRIELFFENEPYALPGDQVTVVFVSGSGEKPTSELSKGACVEKKEGSLFFDNQKVVNKRFKNFLGKIRDIVNSKFQATQSSPIAQTITDLSVSNILRSERVNLLIFSDFREHTSSFSLFGCSDPENVAARYIENQAGKIGKPQFDHVGYISMNRIQIKDTTATEVECIRHFWCDWFIQDINKSTAPPKIPTTPSEKKNYCFNDLPGII